MMVDPICYTCSESQAPTVKGRIFALNVLFYQIGYSRFLQMTALGEKSPGNPSLAAAVFARFETLINVPTTVRSGPIML